MPTFRVDDLELRYELRGAGAPVVLLHGFTSFGDAWVRHGWVDVLVAHGLQPIWPDVRSHGSSTQVFEPAACTTDVLAGDVIALLDHLGIASAHLVGFSMGGGIALEVALTSPSRVRKLVIAGVGDAAIDELHAPEEIAAIAQSFADPGSDSRIRANALAAGNALPPLLPFLQTGGWPGGLRTPGPLPMPALVIVAEADEYMRTTGALLEALQPTEVLHLDGTGHHQVMGSADVQRAAARFLTS